MFEVSYKSKTCNNVKKYYEGYGQGACKDACEQCMS